MRLKFAAPQTLIALVIAASLLVVIAVLWQPFGWNIMGIQEEWHAKAALEDPDLLRNAAPELRSRPVEMPLFSIATLLSPDSFVGFNLLHAFFFFGKGIVLYALLRRLAKSLPLPNSRIFAFLTAVLFVLYPADEGLMTTRATYIHAAAMFYFAGVYCLVAYWQTSHWPWLIGIGLSLGIGLGAYEAGYPLVFFTPLILLWMEKRITQRLIRVTVLWYLVPGLVFLNFLLAFAEMSSMQGRLLEAGTSQRSSGTIVSEMLNSLWIAYQRHFVVGWQTGLSNLSANPLYTTLAAVAALVVAAASGVIGWLNSLTPGEIVEKGMSEVDDQKRVPTGQAASVGTAFWSSAFPEASPRQYALFIATGLMIILLGILVYLPTTRRYVDWRVYFYSSAGAALVVGLLCWLIGRAILRNRGALLFTLLMSALIGVATARLLVQHERYVQMGAEEQYIAGAIIERVPRLTNKADIVLVSPPDDAGVSMGSFSTSAIALYALSYLYKDYDRLTGVTFCLPDYATCQFNPDGLHVQGAERNRTIAYDHMLLFQASSGGGIRLLGTLPSETSAVGYNPGQLIDRASPPPARVYTVFSQWPVTYHPLVTREDFTRFTQSPDLPVPVIAGLRDMPCVGQSDCDVRTWLSGMPQFDLTAIDGSAQRLQTFVGSADTVWYVRTDVTSADADLLLSQLRQDYAPAAEAPWNGQREPEVTIYRRRPDQLQNLFVFGDKLHLDAWTLQNDVQVKACQTISLESWWRVSAPPGENYSMTLVLANAQGVGEARSDSAPANLLTKLWQADVPYLDDRTLTIPCDLAPGDYSVLVGLYNAATVKSLPVTTGDGAPVSGLAYLTTLTVTP